MLKSNNIYYQKGLIKVLALAMGLVIFALPLKNAQAADNSASCGYLASSPMKLDKENVDSSDLVAKKNSAKAVVKEINGFCEKMKKRFPNEQLSRDTSFLGLRREEYVEFKKRFDELLKKDPQLQEQYTQLGKNLATTLDDLSKQRSLNIKNIQENHETLGTNPCGTKFPRGCPAGQECFSKNTYHADVGASMTITSYDCLDPDDFNVMWIKSPNGSKGSGDSIQTNVGIFSSKITTDAYDTTNIDVYMGGQDIGTPRNNEKCQISKMRDLYQSKCYACVIVKTLLETFLTACSTTYDITREAGSKILVIGSLIWLAFFAFKNVSSFSSVEPGALVNTLFVFLFKVMTAYIIINSGLTTIIHYTINPLITAGADYGLGLMSIMQDVSGAGNHDIVMPVIKDGNIQTEIISASVMNKIMMFTENLDKTVSTNLVIGHALTCHALNAGAWDFKLFFMVNIWIWLCGAAIWFCGFMLTLSICYYLLDISFKLGFAILALPVVIGLWPFNLTKDKLKTCLSIIFSSAATFAFLALTTTYALALISSAMRGLTDLFNAIEKGDAIWISDTFDITGPYLMIILFAYLYSIKLIGSTIGDYVDKFFSDGVFGSQSPMHHKLTQATDIAKQKTLGAGGFAYDALKTQGKKAGGSLLSGIGDIAKKSFKSDDKPKADNKPKADDKSKTTKR